MDNEIKKILKKNYKYKLVQLGDIYSFNDEKIKIVTSDLSDSKINKIFYLSNYLFYNNINNLTFLFNINSKIYSEYNDKKIVLLKINDRDTKILFKDIKKINIGGMLEKYDIINDFKFIVDNYENEVNKNNYQNYYDNFFIGIAENSIQLLSICDTFSNENLCHKIDLKDYNKINFYNPFNYINTNYVYDLAIFIKYRFLLNSININTIENILQLILDKNDQVFFMSVLIFPNFYFDKSINISIDNLNNFLKLIKICICFFDDNENLNDISWLKEKYVI